MTTENSKLDKTNTKTESKFSQGLMDSKAKTKTEHSEKQLIKMMYPYYLTCLGFVNDHSDYSHMIPESCKTMTLPDLDTVISDSEKYDDAIDVMTDVITSAHTIHNELLAEGYDFKCPEFGCNEKIHCEDHENCDDHNNCDDEDCGRTCYANYHDYRIKGCLQKIVWVTPENDKSLLMNLFDYSIYDDELIFTFDLDSEIPLTYPELY